MLDSGSRKRLIEQAKVARIHRKPLKHGSTDAPAHKVVKRAPLETESIYRTLVENTGEGIVVAQDGMLRFANPRLADVLGCSLKELLSRPFIEFVHPDDRERVTEIHVKRFNGEQVPAAYEFRIVDKQGNMKWLENSAILIDWGGRPAVMGFLRDVTERKQAEEALRESEKRFRSLSEATFEGIAFSENGVLVDANEAFARMYRCSLEELKGKSVLELVTPEDRELVAENICSGYEGVCEQKGLRKDGSLIDLEIRGRTVTYHGRKMRMTAIRDITERKKADQALRASEEWLKILFESAPDAYYIHDLEGKFVDGNRAAEELVGYQKEEAIGKTFFKLGMVTEADVPKINAAIADNRDGKPAEPLELTLNRKDGSKVMVETRSYPVDIAGETLILGIARDITERKRAEDEIRSLSSVVEQSTEGMAIADLNGNLIFINKAWCKMHGYKSCESLVGKNLEIFHNKKQLKNDVIPFNEEVKKNGTCTGEVGHITKDGKPFPTLMTTTLLKDARGNPFAMAGIAKDITKRKQAEDKALEYQMQLKSLALQLSSTEERERHRLAIALHDQIGQSLVFSKLKLDQLRASEPLGELTEALEEVCNHLGQAIHETRTLTFDLSYPVLYELGFEVAVAEWLRDEIQEKYGIETEIESDGLHKPLDDDIGAVLFRNARELLVNVVKHAQAQNVKVSVHRVDGDIRVSVEDDGVGFDPVDVTSRAAKKAKFGLFSIRQRLEQLGGVIEIASQPGRGSRILMTAPLKQTETDNPAQTA